MKKYTLLVYICFAAIVLSGCKKAIDENIKPFNDKSDQELLNTIDGLTTATNGNYALLVTAAAGDTQYDVSWFNISELKGNNIWAATQAYPQTRDDSYTFTNSPTLGITASFWRMSYRIVFGVNKVINAVVDGQGPAYDQLKGENYFLRAMAYFNMVRAYGRPYYQDNAAGLAVPLSLSSTGDNDNKPKRNTVKEVYAQIVSDLEKAAALMTQAKTNNYVRKETAWALLSRVYLYMGGTPSAPQLEYNAKSVEYADKVIASNVYTLLQGAPYSNSFAVDSKNNKEAIFSFRHDDTNGNKINEFLTPRDLFGYLYQGEYAASPDYMAILNQNDGDLRKNFITVETDDRITDADKTRNSINKFNYQQISAPGGFDFSSQSRSGTPYLRIAEMYLNKAEALAKLDNNTEALIALNLVRTRSLAPAWTTATLAAANMTVFQAALNERRLELAFEGHSSFDNFRNGLPVTRNYSDYIATAGFTVPANDKRVIYPLPPKEIELNPDLKQNPL
uniref:RagB/SusD family nutrient uptake outer membrane protein n=1 Tax=Pedobacter schmidteae TaxID=2201271 RepID=UPI0013CF11BC|nr:RagB/SusD family nutrient uptake outer membrane protein [Pedobacter schmidteae]